VGSGNSTPDAEQTDLDSTVAHNSTTVSSVSGTDTVDHTYAKLTRTFRFNTGVAAGTLSEVGVGWGTSADQLFSRALILDGEGEPTTITILEDEVLDVIYELRVYHPEEDIEGTIELGGVNYDYAIRLAALGSSNLNSVVTAHSTALVYGSPGTLGAVTGTPSGTQGTINPPSAVDSYVGGSYERSFRITVGLSERTTPIYAMFFGTSLGAWQVQFTPELPKTAINVLTLDFTVSWARKV
jgi:hypothetical protein